MDVCKVVHVLQVPKCCRLPWMKVKAHNGKFRDEISDRFQSLRTHPPYLLTYFLCMRSASSNQRYHEILDPEDLTFKDVPLTPLKSNLRAMTTSKLHYDKPRLIHE